MFWSELSIKRTSHTRLTRNISQQNPRSQEENPIYSHFSCCGGISSTPTRPSNHGQLIRGKNEQQQIPDMHHTRIQVRRAHVNLPARFAPEPSVARPSVLPNSIASTVKFTPFTFGRGGWPRSTTAAVLVSRRPPGARHSADLGRR